MLPERHESSFSLWRRWDAAQGPQTVGQSWGWVVAEMGTNHPGFGLPTPSRETRTFMTYKNWFNKKTPAKHQSQQFKFGKPPDKCWQNEIWKTSAKCWVFIGFTIFLFNPVTARPSLTLERQGWATRRARGPCSCQLPGLPKAPVFAWHGLPKGKWFFVGGA